MEQSPTPANPFDLGATIDGVLATFCNQLAGVPEAPGLPTGIPEIDEFTGGLKPGELVVICARPSMGSSTLMLNITEHICVDGKIPALVVSCDLDAAEITRRLIFSRGRVEERLFDADHLTTDLEHTRVSRAANDLRAAPLTVEGASSISVEVLCTLARRLHGKGNVGFIAIDHLQRLKSDSFAAAGGRRREVAEILSCLKSLARELQVPILIIAGMTRGPERRKGKNIGVPRISDLRHRKTIRSHADWIGLLYREAFYRDEPVEKDKGDPAHLILEGMRNFEYEDVKLSFHRWCRRFAGAR